MRNINFIQINVSGVIGHINNPYNRMKYSEESKLFALQRENQTGELWEQLDDQHG